MLAGGDRTAPPTGCRHSLGSPENREDVMAFGERILGSSRALISSNSVSGHATRILKIADQRLGPKSRSVQLKMPKFASQRPHHAPRSAGNTRLFSYRGHGLQRRYCLAGHVRLELRNVVANYLFESPPDLREYSGILAIRVMRRCPAARLDSPRRSLLPPNQRSQRSLREVSNPPISAVQISLQALSETLQFLWRLDARGDHIPKLIALACKDILTQLVVLQFVSCRLS